MKRTKPPEIEKIAWGLPDIGIPAEILFHPKLTHTEKMLFGFIRNLSWSEKGCWASNKWLGGCLGVKGQTISNAISNLKSMEIINVEYLQRSDGMQVRRIFINAEYQNIFQQMITEEGYKNINIDILKKLYPPIKFIINPYKKSLNKVVNKVVNKISNNTYTEKNNSEKKDEEVSSIDKNNNSSIKINKDEIIPQTIESDLDCLEIYNYWMKKASHISSAKYTKNLEKKIKTKLKIWPKNKIKHSILNYVTIYDSNFYYSHAFPLYGFIEQGNGAPRFEQGLDEKRDGDLWKDYCSGKKTNSPSSSNKYQQSSQQNLTELLKAHIQEYFPNEILQESFLNNCYKPAKKILRIEKQEDSFLLEKALINLCDQIEYEQKRNIPKEMKKMFPGSLKLVQNYINWIEDQSWIEKPQIKMFNIQDGRFASFRRNQAKEDNLERDALTGRSYLRE